MTNLKNRATVSAKNAHTEAYSKWLLLLAIGCLFVLGLALFQPRLTSNNLRNARTTVTPLASPSNSTGIDRKRSSRLAQTIDSKSSEEIVSFKLSEFAEKRLRVVHAIADQNKIKVSPEIEQFFQLASAGKLEEASRLF